MLIGIAIVAGLVLGSFLSVLLERLPKREPGILSGRSKCPHCGHVIKWHDLVPLLSYIFLLGRCRHCKERISISYPVLETLLAFSFGFYAYRFSVTGFLSILDLVMIFGLGALFFFDLRHRILPDVVMLPLMLIALVAAFVSGNGVNNMITGVVMMAAFGALHRFSRGRWIGFGDVKFALLVGLLFGYPLAVGVTLVSIWLGALVGLVLIGLGRASMKTPLPFGSFWALVSLVTILNPEPIDRLCRYFLNLS